MRRGERSAAGEVAGGRDEAGGGVARFGGKGEWWPGWVGELSLVETKRVGCESGKWVTGRGPGGPPLSVSMGVQSTVKQHFFLRIVKQHIE
jgi:hypothetical protein